MCKSKIDLFGKGLVRIVNRLSTSLGRFPLLAC